MPYTPEGAIQVDATAQQQQIRAAIQGAPKTGKTFSSCSFPNPVFLSYDRGVYHAPVLEIPFYDNNFVDKLSKRVSPEYIDIRSNSRKPRPYDRRGALLAFLYGDALKLESDQTLIIDANNGVQAAFHAAYWCNPEVDKDAKIKPYAEWGRKIDYFTEVVLCFKALHCNVVYLIHESPDRDDEGRKNGKIRALMSGGFLDELASHFTDWFRTKVISKPEEGKEQEFMKLHNIDRKTMIEWCASTVPDHRSIYLWQTYPDNIADCASSLVNPPKFIPANYQTYCKYQRKPL